LALSAQQYLSMRALFRSALAANSSLAANPSDGEVLGFFAQLLAEANGATLLPDTRQNAIGFAFRGLLSGNIAGVSNPSDADVLSFWTQLASDANGAAALTSVRYLALKSTLCSAIARNYPAVANPALQDLLAYFTAVAGVLVSGVTTFGAAQNYLWRDTKTFTVTGAGANQYVAHDIGSRLAFWTTATSLTIGAVATSGNTAYGDCVDVRVSGAYFTTAQFPDSAGSSIGVRAPVTIALPAGLKLVELIEQGCFVIDINVPCALLPAPVPQRSFTVIGASGSWGYFAWDESNVTPGMFVFDLCWRGRVAWSGRFDAVYTVANNSFGLTSYGVVDQASAIAFVASTIAPRMTGTLEQTVWLEFGAGECLNSATTPTVFAQNLGYLIDAIHAAFPRARVYVQTPIFIVTPSEATANGLGFIMQNYRDVIPPLATGRPYVRIADGLQMGSNAGDISGDGKHEIPGFPVTHIAGHVKAFNYAYPLLAAA
jgi:hypothetical protein